MMIEMSSLSGEMEGGMELGVTWALHLRDEGSVRGEAKREKEGRNLL
jgi:hypothetical protein